MPAFALAQQFAGGRVNGTDPGPPGFGAGDYAAELAALCSPSPCVSPENETDPVLQLSPPEKTDLAAYAQALTDRIADEGKPAPDPSDREAMALWERRPEPIVDTLRFQAKIYQEGFENLTPYAFTRLVLIDVREAPMAARTYRKYEIKRKLQLALERIVLLRAFLSLNDQEQVMDARWLEAELQGTYQMRRTLLGELRARTIWENRQNPQNVAGGTAQ